MDTFDEIKMIGELIENNPKLKESFDNFLQEQNVTQINNMVEHP